MSKLTDITIGVLGPSSPIPQVELGMGKAKLEAEGFRVQIHPQTKKKELFFSGDDQTRAEALFQYALDPSIEILWAGRGGYGAVRLLPLLDQLTRARGVPPKKLFIGYSDTTALLEYFSRKWKWKVLHGPMPGTREFQKMDPAPWDSLMTLVMSHITGEAITDLYALEEELDFLYRPESFKKKSQLLIEAPMTGGNLAILASLIGTPYALDCKGKILFLEDVGEAAYRLDRMVQQLALSGALGGIRAIVLGSFSGCEDQVPDVWAEPPFTVGVEANDRGKTQLLSEGGEKFKPLRPTLSQRKVMTQVFGELGAKLGVPVLWSVPVGHGGVCGALPLGGAKYLLSAQGKLSLRNWA